jgi:hypothetical protein
VQKYIPSKAIFHPEGKELGRLQNADDAEVGAVGDH